MIEEIASGVDKLQEQEERFALAVLATNDGLWDWDLRRHTVYFSPRWKAMLGYAEHEIEHRLEEWQSRIHPDDRVRAQATLEAHLAGETAFYELEHRLRHKDGTYHWILGRGATLRDDEGRPYRMAGSHTDITARKEAEEAVRQSEALYRSLVETSPDAIVLVALDGQILLANRRAADLFGAPGPKSLVGTDVLDLAVPDQRDLFAPARIARVLEECCVRNREYILRRGDGSGIPVEMSASLIREPSGEPRAYLSVLRDVSDRKQTEEQLREAYELLEARVEERTRELSTLLEVSRRVASTLEIEPLLGLVLEQLKKVVDYGGASLLKRVGDDLVIVEYRGPGPRDKRVGRRWRLANVAPIWDRIEQGRPVVIPDVHAGDPLAQAFRAGMGFGDDEVPSHMRSWMGIPLAQKGQTIGVLSLVADESDYFTERQGELALGVASQAAVAMENAKLYKRAQEMAALEERARLARELHDSVTQALFSMTMHAEAAQMALQQEGDDPTGRVARNLRQLSELSEGALAEMRALIFELRPGALQEEGLAAALRKHTAALSAREGLRIEIQAPEARIPLEPSAEEHLYRLAQEALHNVVKHAGAARALVRLETMDHGPLVLEIDDDGVGFDVAGIPDGHLGLRTMSDRAEQIGGTLEIRSAPAAGTTVRVALPPAASE